MGRSRQIIILFIVACFVLMAKAAQIQLFDDKYEKLAQRNTLDQQTIYASRGMVYDRNNEVLVYNKPVYDIEVIYNQVDKNMDTTLFCSLLEIDKATFEKNINKNWKSQKYHKSIPFTFLSKVKPEIFAKFHEHIYRFPGFLTNVRSIRSYPHENAAHLLGYLGEVDQLTLNKQEGVYVGGDYIGKSGLEKKYEEIMRGDKGVRHVITDNLGRVVESFNKGELDKKAVPGTNIITSIDFDLQKYGEELMQGKKGSIVAIEPKTGEILCSISAPTYDPNVLNLDEDRSNAFDDLRDDINKTLLDRTVSAKYPPGSIFKPILSLIAFQEGITGPYKGVSCPGYYEYNTFRYKCHDHPYPSNVGIALTHSCNSYFFDMIRKTLEVNGYNKPGEGLAMLDQYLYKFGLGRKLGVDNSIESTGNIPTPSYYDRKYANEINGWKSTYVMSIGIGQGELELTTVQMANLAAIIANRGKYYTPHLVKSFSNSNMQIDPMYQQILDVGIDEEHFEPVIRGMEHVISWGTGINAKVPGVKVAGKTGTSQNPHGEDHSVFFAFAPVDDPQIAIAVYVENAGFGSDFAAPIAGLMVEKYLKKEISTYSKYKEEQVKAIQLIKVPEAELVPETEEEL